MFDKNKFNAAIVAKGEKLGDAARIMGINKATLYRKVTGKSDFYRHEMETFCTHYDIEKPDEIFFAKNIT